MHNNLMRKALSALALIGLTMNSGCDTPPPPSSSSSSASNAGESAAVATLEKKIRKFAPVDISANVAALPESEREAVTHLVRAAELFDKLFMIQSWAGDPALLAKLQADKSPEGQAELHLFMINKGPWSRIDHNEPFLRAPVPPKPPQANFYPADATKEEVEAWFKTLTGKAHDDATGFYSVIRRGPDGKLTAVPYSVEYRDILTQVGDELKKAAAATKQPTLKAFLEKRAAAFQSNDYFDSDMAWMELDASIEPTIGPYETYEDEWFGYKAAFEAFITLRDDVETKKLGIFGKELQGLENALPIDAKYRNPKLGALAPLTVVNVVFASGDGNRGVQTAAFNLPNDDRVVSQKGAKRVMLKNVQDAKFAKVLVPISGIALPAADRSKVSFDAFFTHILMHEVMHGLGPQQVGKTGEAVRKALKDTYGALEEAKADISGLWALQQLADKGVISPEIAKSMYTTFLASSFRTFRFGINEAHGKGMALQFNTLLDRGAFVVNPDGTFSVDDTKIKSAVADLTREIMTIQAEGNYAAAKALLTKMVVVRPEVQKVLDRLQDVPVDIEPRFTVVR